MNNIKNILITGSDGFIGSNLKFHLIENGYNVLEYKSKDSFKKLKNLIFKSDFVFHLGGTNKSKKIMNFEKNNVILTQKICQYILEKKSTIPIFFSSSAQVKRVNSAYSKTKMKAENILIKNSKKIKVIILRLPNVFGKWSKPNHNSFIATCCYNISRNLRVKIFGGKKKLELIYIDDLVFYLINLLKKNNKKSLNKKIKNVVNITVKKVYEKILDFEKNRIKGIPMSLSGGFDGNLYSTYISFLPKKKFSYQLKTHSNLTGSFTEFMKNQNFGQISTLRIKPGAVRGNHYHHSKVEKFLVVSGKGKFDFRNVKNKKKFTILCSDKKLNVVETIPGFTHNIKNIGRKDLIAIIWSNQIYNIKKPDTIYQKI